MVERLSEQILRRWENFTAKGWLKYYHEKYKHVILYKKRKKLNDKRVQ